MEGGSKPMEGGWRERREGPRSVELQKEVADDEC